MLTLVCKVEGRDVATLDPPHGRITTLTARRSAKMTNRGESLEHLTDGEQALCPRCKNPLWLSDGVGDPVPFVPGTVEHHERVA